MPKSAILKRTDQNPPIRNGEFVASATVLQISQLAMTSPFVGDFQIIGQGRLIVGEHPDLGERFIVTSGGAFAFNAAGTRTFAVWTRGDGTHTGGDVYLGHPDNYLMYDQSEGTLGLYTAAGAGFIADSDGSLYAGDIKGAHMRWSSASRALEIRNGEDIKISLDANGDGSFDGMVYASGGRIYGEMQVDSRLRAGDVDGPSVTLGKFERIDDVDGLVESSEIVATDANNMPWFHVVAGGGTAGGGYFHLGGSGDYAQRLTYDGEKVVVAGAVYADLFVLNGGGSIIGGTTLTNAGKFVAGTGNNVAVIDGEDAAWRIYAGDATPADAPFRVNQAGEVWLDNAHVAGVIQVGGTAGGWTIATDYLAKDTGVAATSAGLAPLDYPFYAGATYANRATAPFRVTPAGALTASSGTIGGWAISAAYIYQNALMMHSDGYIQGGANDDIAVLSGVDATYRFWAGNAVAASAPFRVSKAGAVTATSATITGSVTATSGTIGGWTVGAASLTGGDATLHNTGYLLLGTSNDVVRLDAADATYRLWIGHATAASAPFRVTKAGALTATSATISGAITATSGSITGSLYVGSAAPRIHIDGANKYVESTNFASGTAGFRMEGATGNAEFNNITVRGEIATSVFRKGQVVATSGSIYVTRSASIVTEALTATATTFTLKVKKQLALAPFSAGEIIRIHGETTAVSTWAVVNAGTDGTDHWAYTCYYQSGSSSDTYAIGCAVLSYGPTVVASSIIPNAATATATTFTLDVNEIGGAKPFATGSYVLLVEGGSSTVCTINTGADLGTYWRYTATYVSGSNSNVYNANSPVFGLGATAPSDGRTMITSDATNSPYISIATHAGQPWTAMTERARLGNLTGISGASGYGLWTDNGYFTGTVNANAGSITGFLTLGSDGGIYQGSGTAASPTTGLKIWNDGGTGRIAGYNATVLQWYANTDGKLYAGGGDVRIDSGGVTLKQGTSTPNKITWINPSRSDNVVGELYSQDQSVALGVTSAYLGVKGTYYTGNAVTIAVSALLATSIPSGGAGSAESSHLYVIADATGATGGYIELAPTNIKVMTVSENRLVDLDGYLDVDQLSETGAVPVLKLDQADVSEEMIEFVSTAGTGNAIEAVGSKTLTTTHFIKVTVNGDTRYIPVGTIA